MRILFCGGGTGGHVSPAIAIAECAKNKFGISDFAFVGRRDGKENAAISKKGYKLYEIEISGFIRKFSLENFKRLIKVAAAMKEAKRIIKDFKPDAVVGTGGYVSWPVIRCAQKMKIPTYLHESNAYPGLVTRLLSPKCKKVFLNVKATAAHLKRGDNIAVVGNPVEERFYKTERKYARALLGIRNNEFLITSYAGSGGAEKINGVIFEFIKEYSSKMPKIKHIHATGKKYFEENKDIYSQFKNGKNGIYIKPYIDDLHIALNAADLVIARCGAMTLTELAASKSTAILIPSPNVTNNHQYENAKLLSDKNAAKVIEEKNLTCESLIRAVDALYKNPSKREILSTNIGGEFKKCAEVEILREITKSAT